VGEYYLKQHILDAINEITGTNRHEIYASPDPQTPAHYGAVDILLPDSYTVTEQKAEPPVALELGVIGVQFSRD
ncbi:MAG TPA: hypothetical protein VGD24_02560, partial [Gallionella sp.]